MNEKLEQIRIDWMNGHMNTSDGDWLLKQVEKLERLRKENEIYSIVIGDIEHAMHKVGWNNTRIEEAFEEMNERLKEL